MKYRTPSRRPEAPCHTRCVTTMTALLVAAAEQEEGRELPVEPVVFGLITLGLFAALFAFTWAFRSVAMRTSQRTRASQRS